MREEMPEDRRVTVGPYGTSLGSGPNGKYILEFADSGQVKRPRFLVCLVGVGMGWEHVSVSVLTKKKKPAGRCPTWEEMCFIKDIFWGEGETVVQYHPAKEDYVNMHPHVLHLWKVMGETFPKPDPSMVGIRSFNL